MLDHFGADLLIGRIHPLQADAWRAKLKDEGLVEATISKRVKLARQIFGRAVKWKLLDANPFSDVKAGSQTNKSRQRFIVKGDVERVLEACPDAEWRLIVALGRFGGLRCPSEHLALTWGDVDWEKMRLRVPCSKTERHEGRGERFVPIFPELYPYLREAFELASPGSRYVITRCRDKNANLRTQLQRIIRKAGVGIWPRLFHNLRATRQTELAERFPAHVVSSWLGNTERVARDHYLQVTDAHWERAVQGALGLSAEAEPKAAQTVTGRIGQEAGEAETPDHPEKPGDSEGCGRVLATPVAPTGLEPVTRGL